MRAYAAVAIRLSRRPSTSAQSLSAGKCAILRTCHRSNHETRAERAPYLVVGIRQTDLQTCDLPTNDVILRPPVRVCNGVMGWLRFTTAYTTHHIHRDGGHHTTHACHDSRPRRRLQHHLRCISSDAFGARHRDVSSTNASPDSREAVGEDWWAVGLGMDATHAPSPDTHTHPTRDNW